MFKSFSNKFSRAAGDISDEQVNLLLLAYFKGILALADEDKVSELLISLGYNEPSVSEQTCLDALYLYAEEFARPFARIAREALDSEQVNEIRVRSRVRRAPAANGSTTSTGNTAAAPDKAQVGLQYLDSITNLFGTVSGGVGGIITAVKTTTKTDTTDYSGQAQLEQARTEKAKQENSNTMLWVGLAVAILVVVIVVVLLISKAKK